MSHFQNETLYRDCNCTTDPNDGLLDCALCFGNGFIKLHYEFRDKIGVMVFGIRGRVYDQTGLESCYPSDNGIFYEAQWAVGRSARHDND